MDEIAKIIELKKAIATLNESWVRALKEIGAGSVE